MKVGANKTVVYAAAFVIVLVLFAYFLITYTRRVESVSMLPTLEPGDLVVIQSVPFNSIKVGDIIVYNGQCSTSGLSVIHRVVNVTSAGLITQGDDRRTNPLSDQRSDIAKGPITANCVVGVVVFIVPYIERLATLPYGTNYIIAALIFLAVIYSELGYRGKKEGLPQSGDQSKESPTLQLETVARPSD